MIFDRQAPGVRRFLGDLLRDDAAADEGTQETFVRAHQRLPTIEEPVQVDQAPSPEAMLLSAESDRVLDGALAHLAEERRAALLMRIDRGLGYGEIAAAMGWPLQKVKNEIHRARLQIRASLAGYLDEGAR